MKNIVFLLLFFVPSTLLSQPLEQINIERENSTKDMFFWVYKIFEFEKNLIASDKYSSFLPIYNGNSWELNNLDFTDSLTNFGQLSGFGLTQSNQNLLFGKAYRENSRDAGETEIFTLSNQVIKKVFSNKDLNRKIPEYYKWAGVEAAASDSHLIMAIQRNPDGFDEDYIIYNLHSGDTSFLQIGFANRPRLHNVENEIYLTHYPSYHYGRQGYVDKKYHPPIEIFKTDSFYQLGNTIPATGVNHIIKFNGNLIIGGDPDDDESLLTSNNIQRLEANGDWMPIGSLSMGEDGYDREVKFFTQYKNELYCITINSKIWKYQSMNNWIEIDWLQEHEIISGRAQTIYFYKDQLYIGGNFQVTNGTDTLKKLVRTFIPNEKNTAPIALKDEIIGDNLTPFSFYPTQNDTDEEGDFLSVTILDSAKHGMLDLTPHMALTFYPKRLYSGFDSIIYQICDRGGLCDTAEIIVEIIHTNTPPQANTDTLFYNPDSDSITVLPLVNDTDLENDFFYLESVINGSVFNSTAIFYPEKYSTKTDTGLYVICDLFNECDTGRIILSPQILNTAPESIPDNYEVDLQLSTTVNIFPLKNDIDSENHPLKFALLSNTWDHGILNFQSDTSFEYMVKDSLSQDTLFETLNYKACDPYEYCDSSEIFITILPLDKDTIPTGIALDENTMNIFPNPFSNNVSFESPLEIDVVWVSNIKGSKIMEIKNPGKKFIINTSNWKNGVYVITGLSKSTIITKKLIKH
ncbi:MAG: hypothetical protein ACI81S_001254 [Sphingobacteriales bacterium]|jgi:hypothetical protein